MGDDFYLTVAQVAERLQMHENWVRARIKDHSLQASRLGREWRIDPVVLREFVSRQAAQPVAPVRPVVRRRVRT